MKNKEVTRDCSNEEKTSDNAKVRLAEVFTYNEKVVWDSNFGYEIGYFLGEGNQYNTWLVDIRTGLIAEPCSHSTHEIYKYTHELIDSLTKKYGYEKEVFGCLLKISANGDRQT